MINNVDLTGFLNQRTIAIKVITESKDDYIEIKSNQLIVYVTDTPLLNKANIKVIHIINKYFNKQCKIVFGHSSKNKVIKFID